MDNSILNNIINKVEESLNQNSTGTSYDENGRVVAQDPELNKILQEVQDESGPLGAVVPAVTFIQDGEDKVYIALLSQYEKDESFWFTMTGRQKFYDTLVQLIKAGEVDPNQSFVIAGDLFEDSVTKKSNMKINNMMPITVYRFMKTMKDSKKIIESDDHIGFDIDEYCEYSDNGDTTILEIG